MFFFFNLVELDEPQRSSVLVVIVSMGSRLGRSRGTGMKWITAMAMQLVARPPERRRRACQGRGRPWW